jgi:hypothetical protein
MDTKKFVLAVLVYVVLTFVIAAGWHLVLFKSMYEELAIFTRKEPLIPLGVISMLLQGLVLAYLYPRLSGTGTPLVKGIKFGLLVGVLMASIAVFAEAGKQFVTSLPTWLAFESTYYLLQFGVVGVGMAMVYGRPR